MALNSLKSYQEQLLDDFSSYLSRCRELQDPAEAFRESTLKGFSRALPYYPLPGAEIIPYVCLRVPTGGGKTRIAGQSIKRVNDYFLGIEHALILWLVPSDPIREQTLHSLKTPGELLYQDMQDLFGSVHVLDIQEALYIQPATLNTGNTIIVATMQSFKRETDDGLRVYRQNGNLMPHFSGTSSEQKGEHSLMDVIRLHHPFVIVDEAHNQGTPLAVDTLVRFNPACILELTATPDRANQPSNVLRSVSAATLQAENMLKLPLELTVHPEWQRSMAEAISRLRQLEKEAAQEFQQTGEKIKPLVMLIQAERQTKEQETFTPERVKQHLINDFNISADTIAIATGAQDELSGKKLGDPDYPQFIITVDKLREGWDCPFAYLLFSFRNTTSATAVEQILGRILRMPHVKRKQHEALNRCYAYVVSSEFAATVQGLRDGLVQSGFERLETQSLIQTHGELPSTGDLFAPQGDLIIPLPESDNSLVLPDETALETLPKSLRDKLEISPESGTLTLKGGANNKQIQQLADTFRHPEIAKSVRDRLEIASSRQSASLQKEITPAERGFTALIPLLTYKQSGFFDVFDETPLLDADWEIEDFNPALSDSEFTHDAETMYRAALSISQLEKIECSVYERLDSQLALFGKEHGWEATDLVYWLDRNLPFPYSERDRKVAWINAAVDYLLEKREFSLDELAYRKFRLRGALERKMAAGLVLAKQRIFNELFDDESQFAVLDEYTVSLEPGRYAYDFRYAGFIQLKRHFYPIIGNLKDVGEEFECAEFIANRLEGVDWWLRNVEKKPTSFWLQTASDRFYPDFLIQMSNGPLVAVEYKGAHISDTQDSREKKRIGELWARRSEGRCLFVWVENKDWSIIHKAVTSVAS